MEIIIEGKEVFSPDDFYKQLSKQVPELGGYFGNNLDALWDYIDIFDGKIKPFPDGIKPSVDHILPRNYIENINGFNKLPKDI